jgi:hypothetical protein
VLPRGGTFPLVLPYRFGRAALLPGRAGKLAKAGLSNSMPENAPDNIWPLLWPLITSIVNSHPQLEI